MRTLCAMLLAAVMAAHGQSAKVIPLSAADAAEAKDLKRQQDDLDAKTKAFRQGIVERYLLTKDEKDAGSPYPDKGWTTNSLTAGCFAIIGSSGMMQASPCSEKETPAERAKRKKEEAARRWYRKGWDWGLYEYSDDFLYIVPVHPAEKLSPPCGITWTSN